MAQDNSQQKMMDTAILVDGGFYLKRARALFGEKSPKERADELEKYCDKHIRRHGNRHLYRIFYYDCPPSGAVVWNPLTKKPESLARTSLYRWATEFQEELIHKRKFALRRGELTEKGLFYTLKQQATKDLLSGKLKLDDLSQSDLSLNIRQKGVDMKLGLDIASIAYKRLANQIIMIAGDSDFVPAAKMARKEGIDFILDPMWNHVTDSLLEHIDGLETCCQRPKNTAGIQQESLRPRTDNL